MLKRRYQLMLLIAVVLAVYYQSIYSEDSIVDDAGMIDALFNMKSWSLKGLLLPGGEGMYYRPLLALSFMLDKDLWFLTSSFMHLENILFHVANAVLVYFICVQLLSSYNHEKSWLPLIAALCFGLHPVNVESVSWISGRTDVMACTFVLLSALFLIRFKQKHKKLDFILATLFLLLGTLCKEVALAFMAGALLILIARNRQDSAEADDWSRFKSKYVALGVAFIGGSGAIFFLLRSSAFTSNRNKIGLTIKYIISDPDHSVFVLLRTFGFYIKKLFAPFPLNFAIVDVDPLYELLAVPLILICLLIAWRRTLLSAIFIAGICMILPAYPIAFNQIAWTPYAERYIYIASAFIMISSVCYFGFHLHELPVRAPVYGGVSVLLVSMALLTFQRTTTWKTNLALLKDTVDKSPNFSKVRTNYGIALLNKNDYKNAKEQFIMANSLYSFEYDERTDLLIAEILRKEGKEKEAWDLYMTVMKKKKGKSVMALGQITSYLERKRVAARDISINKEISRELISYYKELYDQERDPYTLYKIGQMALALGERQESLEYFRRAYDKFPEGDEYRGFAKKIVARLEKE